MTAFDVICFLLAEVLLLAFANECGYQSGEKKGYARRVKEEIDWWTHSSDAVDEAQKKIWKEEMKG